MTTDDGDDETTRMNLSESIYIPSFATLPGGGSNDNSDAVKADCMGRTIMCSPSSSIIPFTQRQQATPPPGLAFRISSSTNNGNVVEAIQVIPPMLNNTGDDEEECVIQGGDIKIIGSFPIINNNNNNHKLTVSNMSCSHDAKLVLLGFIDGSILCLNVLFSLGGNTNNEICVQFTQRWTMTMPSTIDTNNSGNDNDGSDSNNVASFPTLEFINDTHSFLAVIVGGPSSSSSSNRTMLWMDAASSTGTPPTINL